MINKIFWSLVAILVTISIIGFVTRRYTLEAALPIIVVLTFVYFVVNFLIVYKKKDKAMKKEELDKFWNSY